MTYNDPGVCEVTFFVNVMKAMRGVISQTPMFGEVSEGTLHMGFVEIVLTHRKPGSFSKMRTKESLRYENGFVRSELPPSDILLNS